MRRQWAERIVIVIAALASIATSPRKWALETTPPPPAAGKAMVVTIDASREPEVWVVAGQDAAKLLYPTEGGRATVEPAAALSWPGQAHYFVPAGAHLQRIEIRDRCTMKLCGGKCKPPDTEYVRVTSATAVEAWIAEARSTPVTTVLDASKPTPRYRVVVEASRRPITLEIMGAPGHLAPSVWRGSSGPPADFHVAWNASNRQVPPETVTWTARATIQAECPGSSACAAPAGEVVRILAVEEEAPGAR